MMASNEKDSQPEKEQNGNSKGQRRNFLKVGIVASLALVVAGIAGIAESLVSPSAQSTTTSATTGSATTSGASSSTGSASPFPRVMVANISDLSLDTPLSFNYPLQETPNMLVKMGVKATGGVGPDGDIVAFSQICQHLGCVYGYVPSGQSPKCMASYKANTPVGYCCCHGTIYDLADGAKVLGGPSQRPQPQVILEFDSATGKIYAVGMGPPTIFGHNTGSNDVLNDLQGGTLCVNGADITADNNTCQ